MTRTILIEHGGIEYHGTVATIDKTVLGCGDHSILTARLHCKWLGGGIGIGDYGLDNYDPEAGKRVATAYGLDFLVQMMQTVGVAAWESLPGQQVIILFENAISLGETAKGIAGLTNDKVMVFREHAESWFE